MANKLQQLKDEARESIPKTQLFNFGNIRNLLAELLELFSQGWSYDLKSVSSENYFNGNAIALTKPKTLLDKEYAASDEKIERRHKAWGEDKQKSEAIN